MPLQSSSPVYKTYLKVGQMTPDTSSVTPFIIEWTPDLLVNPLECKY